MKARPSKTELDKALREAQERIKNKEHQFEMMSLQASGKRKIKQK